MGQIKNIKLHIVTDIKKVRQLKMSRKLLLKSLLLVEEVSKHDNNNININNAMSSLDKKHIKVKRKHWQQERRKRRLAKKGREEHEETEEERREKKMLKTNRKFFGRKERIRGSTDADTAKNVVDTCRLLDKVTAKRFRQPVVSSSKSHNNRNNISDSR